MERNFDSGEKSAQTVARRVGTNQDPEGSEVITRIFDRALAIREAAEVLGVSYATIRRLMLAGRIPYQQVSERRTVIRESDVRDYLDSVTVDVT